MPLVCTRSMSRLLGACALSLLSAMWSPVRAQEADGASYDGTWTARVHGADGKWREATVVIAGYEGTWQYRAGGPSACAGKKMPMTFQTLRRTAVAFIVWGEKATRTCPNLSVFVRPAGAKMLEGIADAGVKEHDPDEFPDQGASSAARAPLVGTAGSIRLTRR
jgi:hypothetical protein